MKMIILAAGKGERLYPLTRNTPKPLLDMGNGNTLLEEQLFRMRASKCITEVVIVAGYLAGQVEAKVGTFDAGPVRIRTLFNPFYASSNNLMSLWLARGEMDEDFMVTNGDNLFSPNVFSEFEQNVGEGVWLALAHKSEFVDDDMKVKLEREAIAHVSKKLSGPDAMAESPGLSLVRGARARRRFVGQLERLARQPEHLNSFWLQVYNSLYEHSEPASPWFFDAENHWQEMDFHQDVDLLRRMLQEKTRSVSCPPPPMAADEAPSNDVAAEPRKVSSTAE